MPRSCEISEERIIALPNSRAVFLFFLLYLIIAADQVIGVVHRGSVHSKPVHHTNGVALRIITIYCVLYNVKLHKFLAFRLVKVNGLQRDELQFSLKIKLKSSDIHLHLRIEAESCCGQCCRGTCPAVKKEDGKESLSRRGNETDE